VKEELVARRQITVQAMLLDVLDERAAHAVHDALGAAGGARREQHEERVVPRQTRQRLERQRVGCTPPVVDKSRERHLVRERLAERDQPGLPECRHDCGALVRDRDDLPGLEKRAVREDRAWLE